MAGRRGNAPGPAQEVEAPMQREVSRRRQYGTGSIFEERGSWYGQWRPAPGAKQIKRKLGPMRRPGSRDGLTRKQAEARLRQLMQQIRNAAPDERLYFKQAAERYIEHTEHVMGRKESTLADYRIIARALSRHLGGKAIDRITVDDLAAYMALRAGEGRAPKTISNHMVFAHAVFAYALKRGWTQANPVAALDRPRSNGASPDIRFLTLEEVEALIRAVPDDDLGGVERVLYLTAAMSGLRLGELIALRWLDVGWSVAQIRVRQGYSRNTWGTPKTLSSSRAVPLADRLAGELDRHFQASAFQGDGDLVFAHPVLGTPLDASKLRKRFYAAMRRAGMGHRCGRRNGITFHSFRHTFATRMAAAGAPLRAIQEWLGHEDPKTTEVYRHYAPDPTGAAALVERAFARTDSRTNLSASEGKTEQQKPL
jgi:integrase